MTVGGPLCAFHFEVYATIAGWACILALGFSGFHISHHLLKSQSDKVLQRFELIILALVPLYAIDAFVGLNATMDPHMLPEVLSLFRELYESFVLVAFVQFMLIWLGGWKRVVCDFRWECQKPQHVWETCCPKFVDIVPVLHKIPMPFRPGGHLLVSIIRGILQYSVVTVAFVVLSSLILVCCLCFAEEPAEAYKKVSAPLLGLKGLSVAVAMYCLFLFLCETERNIRLHERFEQVQPHTKFWAIKLLICCTTLQKVVCETLLPLKSLGIVEAAGCTPVGLDIDQVGSAVQNFLLCVELVVFALLHYVAYPVHEFDSEEVRDADGGEAHWLPLLSDISAMKKQMRRHTEQLERVRIGEIAPGQPEFAQTFNSIDSDGSGDVSLKELMFFLETAHFDADAIESIRQMAGRRGSNPASGRLEGKCEADQNGDGTITLDEFEGAMRSRTTTQGGLTQPLLQSMS